MRISDWSSDVCSSDLASRTAEDARRYYDSYAGAIARIGKAAKPGDPHANHGISIKLSALHPRYEYLQAARVRDELIPNVIELAKAARAVNIPLMIDAEESDRLEPHMDVFAARTDAGVADGGTGQVGSASGGERGWK